MHLSAFQNHVFLAVALAGASIASAQDNVVLGSGNECTDGRVKLTCSSACELAMQDARWNVANSRWRGDEKSKNWPSGCYFCDGVSGCTDGVWFNTHKKGKARGDAAPLCALPTADYSCNRDVLFTGDSDIESWPDAMRLEFFDSSVNKGVGGWKCKTLKKKIAALLTEYSPLWTVVVCGENDLAGNGDVGKAFRDFKKVIAEITKMGSRALYIGTKPEPSTKALHPKYRQYDKKIRKYAKSLAAGADAPPLVMIDSYKGFKDLGNPDSLYDDDELHLANLGYAYWSDWANDAVAAANGGSECTVWQSYTCTQSR